MNINGTQPLSQASEQQNVLVFVSAQYHLVARVKSMQVFHHFLHESAS